ncbi:MAG: kelch repeat-containing protein [Chloroflexota bacterium]|nr:kelch repeat-containing protein [Chloroflexota bacterium]
MNVLSITKRYLVLLLFALLVVLIGVQSVSSQVPNVPNTVTSFPVSTPSPEVTTCRPGSGWRWTKGPSKPEIAEQVQQTLGQMGIEVLVEANGYGETDSCGTFNMFGIDFAITVRSENQISETDQQELTDRIYPILVRFGKPNLGNARVTFLPSNIVLTIKPPVSISPSTVASQSPASTLDAVWHQVTTADSPLGRYTHGLAYDNHRNVAVLFGGDSTGSSRLSDTWEFNGTNWTQITPTQSPPGRANIDQTLVYDSNRRRTVLFGGLGASNYLSDTWEYDGTTWTQVEAGLSPQRRDSYAMVFDSHRGVVVLFGGYGSSGSPFSDTWEYNGAWQQVSTSQSPNGRFHHAMAYDESRNVTVLFGGLDGDSTKLEDTWEYDGTTWHEITPTQSPPARDNHSMTYDSARDVIVLFGGMGDSGPISDTWEYDGTTWRQITTTQSPAPRTEVSLTYDRQQDAVLFFGGGYWSGGILTVFTETWEYVGPSHRVFLPTVMCSYAPSEVFNRKVCVVVYDPILNNGQNLSTYLGWNNHADLTQGTIDFFGQATNNRLNYSVIYTSIITDGWPEKIDGFRYTEEEYLAVINGQSPPHSPDTVDYNKIVNSPILDICGKANRGEIDEVWIYNGPAFGFYESTLVGPGAYWYNSPPVSGPHDCNRLIPIMGPSPERNLDCAVHNFGHRTESTMTEVYGSWQQNRTAHNWERFALVEALSPDYFYSGCGNIHYPPNGTSDYDYGNTSTVLSNCDDFANYPDLGDPAETAKSVTCSDWGCTQINYLAYWFGHLPSNNGCGPDTVANDWWEYFVDPALALNPSSPCQSSFYK